MVESVATRVAHPRHRQFLDCLLEPPMQVLKWQLGKPIG